jgi:hypothetical protein
VPAEFGLSRMRLPLETEPFGEWIQMRSKGRSRESNAQADALGGAVPRAAALKSVRASRVDAG